MNYITYISYLLISSSIIIWVGNVCYTNGRVFIVNYFPKHVDFGNRINKLLRLAYYFLNIGLTVFCLYTIKNINSLEAMLVEISEMIGFILLIIGVLHFNNIILIALLHKHLKP